MQRIGEQFKHLFDDQPITKILTIEASGIAPALMTGLAFNVPVVFARKSKSAIQDDNSYHADVFSYTKKVTNHILVDRKFISPTDHVLIIDGFFGKWRSGQRLIQVCDQAKCTLDGIGIVIEKAFQKAASNFAIQVTGLSPSFESSHLLTNTLPLWRISYEPTIS